MLLPKKEAARTPDAFRPISLQNCPMKLFTKVMANRVRPYITSLVDGDQTGFVHGRNIAENYVYAADLLACCHKRKIPTVALKLDFRKAFDSVSWDSLLAILEARGFDSKWIGWISTILNTGKISILLNGVPGRWFSCRRGLRQGDPLSPFLFIVVADVLQRLAFDCDDLRHPIVPDLSCPVLQYADDTLILVPATMTAIQALHGVLSAFSIATGLTINFHKSTFVPLHVDAAVANSLASVLGCSLSSFPQTYLGLPLSPTRLLVSDYAPLIAAFDKYLSGWRARLLSAGGRLVLTNAVLGSLAAYYMCSLKLPTTVLEMLDSRRRAFLWTGEDRCSGAKSLVAWDSVCYPFVEGGLGIKDLECQNHCLLMKFVHKFLSPCSPPWKVWVQRMYPNIFRHRPDSFLARLIYDELPRYRSITSVQLGRGDTTAFWLDHWVGDGPLFSSFPALFFALHLPWLLCRFCSWSWLQSGLAAPSNQCCCNRTYRHPPPHFSHLPT